jgi:hypothetical protein
MHDITYRKLESGTVPTEADYKACLEASTAAVLRHRPQSTPVEIGRGVVRKPYYAVYVRVSDGS